MRNPFRRNPRTQRATVYGYKLEPHWLDGYIGEVDGRMYRFVQDDDRWWSVRAPTTPLLGKVIAREKSLRGAVFAVARKVPGVPVLRDRVEP